MEAAVSGTTVPVRRAICAGIAAVLALSAATLAQNPPPVATTAIRAGLLVDPAEGTAARNQIILVRDTQIVAVGGNVAIPAGARVVDLTTSTVLPGLFDAHTHLCMDLDVARDAGNYFLTTLQDPDSYRAVQGVVNARTMLEAGFTSVRDVGNEGNYACSSVRRAIDAGKIPGPTMITAGRIIAPFGGQFRLQPDKPGLAEPEYFFADSRDEMQKAVRQNAHFGAGVIKIVVDDQRYIYSEDDIRFIVQEAQRAGLKVAAHAWTERGAHNAAAAGVASIEHLNGITDADLELAKRNGVTAVFTPFPMTALLQQRSKEEAQKQHEAEISRLGAARRLGVPVAFGTDAISELTGMTRGESAVEWIDSYVDAGFSAKEILKAMVPTAAALFGVEKRRGAIRPEMAADIIAAPGNPLDDIKVLKRVSFVMKNGRIIKLSGKGSE